MTVLSGSVPAAQLTLDFEPGLVERHGSLLAAVRSGAYSQRKPLKALAADMDLSQSELSRKLSENPDDPRRLSVSDLERYLDASGDVTPVLYLVEKYLADDSAKRRAAQAKLLGVLPELAALIRAAGVEAGL